MRIHMARRRVLGAALLTIACFASSPVAAQSAWRPSRNVEIIAGASPGGGFDTTARVMQRIWQDKKIVEVPLSVVNKPGGGGTIGYVYMNTHPGDGHYLSISSPSMLASRIMGRNPLSHSDLTPVAQLFNEYIVFLVRAESPLKTGKDIVERLKKDPSALSIGIATALGNHNHMATGLALRAGGVDLKALKTPVFNSGGEATTALLGGHIDLVPTPASNAVSLLASGKVRALAVSSSERLPGVFATTPTWKEQGYAAVFSSWRGLVGPRGLTAEQLRYWEAAVEKMVDSEEWKQDLQKNYWLNGYMNSAASRQFLDHQYGEFRAVLNDLGLAR